MTGKRILAFGAHPDDIEFGCGAVLLDFADRGGRLELVVLSRGEAGTHGDAATRVEEARKAASVMGASLQVLPTAGDTRIRADLETTLLAAKIIRQVRPDLILAPTGVTNQHPDHRETCAVVRDAFRLARYGKTPGLEDFPPHAARLLLFYDVSTEAVGVTGLTPMVVDVSSSVEKWTTLMGCHVSQTNNLDYIDLQLSRARALGIQMGVHSAVRLYSEGPLLVPSATLLGDLTSPRL